MCANSHKIELKELQLIKPLDKGAGQSEIKTAIAKSLGPCLSAITKNHTRLIIGTYEQPIRG